MLQEVTHIEGLDNAFEHVDMLDDTNPGAIQVHFEVRAEEMPFKTAEKGTVVRENFVWIVKKYDLGRSEVSRRVRDKLEFDETNQKWKIKRLLEGRRGDGTPISDIARYSQQWNAFMKGLVDYVIGTPINVLFKADPSRAEIYKSRGIKSVEQLASLNDSDLQSMGMGTGADKQKAAKYLDKIGSAASGIEVTHQLEERDRLIRQQQAQIDDLSSKLTELLEAQLKKGSKKTKVEAEA